MASGASRGALNLHQSLLNINLNSMILSDESVEAVNALSIERVESIHDYLEVDRFRLGKNMISLYPERNHYMFSTGLHGADLAKLPHFQWADVIHFHWVSDDFVPIQVISEINKPLVWTMRDMWLFTGGCHYTFDTDCCRYQTDGCGACPFLGSDSEDDLAAIVFKEKQTRLARENLYPIGISQWLVDNAKSSLLLKDKSIRLIYNTIDAQSFKPADKEDGWRYFQKKCPEGLVIGFGAASSGTKDVRKGFDLLSEAFDKLKIDMPVHLVIFGSSDIDSEQVSELGVLESNEALSMAYACCDVFVIPSLQEAFGKTAAEAQACQRPVICYEGTGCAEVIEPNVTGLIASDMTADGLIKAINEFANLDEASKNQMGVAARHRCMDMFDLRHGSEKYAELYRKCWEDMSMDDRRQNELDLKRKLMEVSVQSERYRKEYLTIKNSWSYRLGLLLLWPLAVLMKLFSRIIK